MTDEHDGAVNDVPVALVSTNSTAHILDQINPSINPYSLTTTTRSSRTSAIVSTSSSTAT